MAHINAFINLVQPSARPLHFHLGILTLSVVLLTVHIGSQVWM